MLKKTMTLNQMINFKPNDEDMFNLELDEILYLKIIIIGNNLENNHKDIRILLNPKYIEEINKTIKNINKTNFFDFEYKNKAISIFNLKSKENFYYTHSLFEDILKQYQFYGDIAIYFFTHNNKEYILSNYNGIINTQEINN